MESTTRPQESPHTVYIVAIIILLALLVTTVIDRHKLLIQSKPVATSASVKCIGGYVFDGQFKQVVTERGFGISCDKWYNTYIR